MIDPTGLRNQAMVPSDLTHRQREVVVLVDRYVSAAHEMPSLGWLSRQMNISRERARQLLQSIRDKRERCAR